jgi:hypothetical protein
MARTCLRSDSGSGVSKDKRAACNSGDEDLS